MDDVARRGETGGPLRIVALPGRIASPEPSTTDWERTKGTLERGGSLLAPLPALVPFGRELGCGGGRDDDGRLGADE